LPINKKPPNCNIFRPEGRKGYLFMANKYRTRFFDIGFNFCVQHQHLS
jgi:hypothetical protein